MERVVDGMNSLSKKDQGVSGQREITLENMKEQKSDEIENLL